MHIAQSDRAAPLETTLGSAHQRTSDPTRKRLSRGLARNQAAVGDVPEERAVLDPPPGFALQGVGQLAADAATRLQRASAPRSAMLTMYWASAVCTNPWLSTRGSANAAAVTIAGNRRTTHGSLTNAEIIAAHAHLQRIVLTGRQPRDRRVVHRRRRRGRPPPRSRRNASSEPGTRASGAVRQNPMDPPPMSNYPLGQRQRRAASASSNERLREPSPSSTACSMRIRDGSVPTTSLTSDRAAIIRAMAPVPQPISTNSSSGRRIEPPQVRVDHRSMLRIGGADLHRRRQTQPRSRGRAR